MADIRDLKPGAILLKRVSVPAPGGHVTYGFPVTIDEVHADHVMARIGEGAPVRVSAAAIATWVVPAPLDPKPQRSAVRALSGLLTLCASLAFLWVAVKLWAEFAGHLGK